MPATIHLRKDHHTEATSDLQLLTSTDPLHATAAIKRDVLIKIHKDYQRKISLHIPLMTCLHTQSKLILHLSWKYGR